jgi:deazaflavin-dependent oxidoreductase (nitroreductase family)
VGSKGGADSHPGWYFNLLENPQATLQVGPEEITVTARLAEGAERDRLWTQMAAIYPPYNDYQAKTSRPIPIFIFERATG